MEDMKEITGYEDYMITKDGRVWSKISNKFLSISPGTDGRNVVALYKNGKKIRFRVYKLVAQEFLPNPTNLPMVNHINGNCADDRLENLEWCDNSHNTKEAYRLGCYHNKRRCELMVINKESGFIYEKVHSIRRCAIIFNLPRKGIEAILKGRKKNKYNYDFYYND